MESSSNDSNLSTDTADTPEEANGSFDINLAHFQGWRQAQRYGRSKEYILSVHGDAAHGEGKQIAVLV